MSRWRRPTPSRRLAPAAAVVAAFAVLASTAGAAGSSLSWTGQSRGSLWSVAANWNGAAPTNNATLGTLTFGDLGAVCNRLSSKDACYDGANDLNGLAVNQIDIDDNAPYELGGGVITLGAGGITAEPGPKISAFPDSDEFNLGSPALETPILLSAPQTWSIQGSNAIFDGPGLEVTSIAGSSALSLDFTKGASLSVDGDTETGPITASGDGNFLPGTSINGTDENPVNLENGANLQAANAGTTAGPVDVTSGASVTVGTWIAPEGTLAVNGGLTFDSSTAATFFLDQAGSEPRTDYSQLTASGNVNLAGAKLTLLQGYTSSLGCENLRTKAVDTLLSTTGTLTGTFAGIPDGTAVKIKIECDHGKVDATAVINYTADTVTATIKTGGDAGDVPTLKKEPKISGTRVKGHTLTVSTGSWTNKPTSYSYQWFRCSLDALTCSEIHGADHRAYTLKSADVGRIVAADVTAKNEAGRSTDSGPVRTSTAIKAK